MAEIQNRLATYEKLNIQVAALSIDTPNQSRAIAEKMNLDFPLLCDTQKKVIDRFHLRNPFEHDGIAYPGTFIITPDARVCYRSLDGTASRLDLTEELAFLEQHSRDRALLMQGPPKKSWIFPTPKDTWGMARNMVTQGNFADWKHFILLPLEYLFILADKIKTPSFDCQKVGLDFAALARVRLVTQIDIPAPPKDVFQVLEDQESWPLWFKDIQRVEWTSAPPFKKGSSRQVALKGLVLDETFIAWEPGRRFSFSVTAASRPLFRAFMEDYLLEPSGVSGTKLTWTVAYDPGIMLKAAGPLGKHMLKKSFQKGAAALAAFMEKGG